MLDHSPRLFVFSISMVLLLSNSVRGQGPSLQDQLAAEGSAALVKAARASGDPTRGAVVFHQAFLACAKCHTVGQASSLPVLGPDLSRPEPNTTADDLIESVLEPSKVIRKGFEPVVVELTDGTTITGLFVEETREKLVLRDATRLGESVTILKSQIEDRVKGKTSIMPVGQVNVLASRQQFLDLARYLIEIAEGGPERARQLQPPPSLFAFVLPEYEQQIDHAGILRDLDDKAFKRGEAIYNRLCINCHGTKDRPGSLPTSLKFYEGKFKNGHEPYRMYQTLTHGFGLMAPQTWMVPQQKYDVIHYVRQMYLKPHNPTQYSSIDAAYLESLPKGNSRGPAPSNVEPWSSMNYGPFLAATYEVGGDGLNFAQKGIAIRLDPGPGGVSRGKHWQVFDHDTLRIAAAWSAVPDDPSNFIDWHGINFDGRHQIHPRVEGRVAYANPTGPGWADPKTGEFEDPRLLGRDQRRYGPLPRDWGKFHGIYQFGDQTIVSYSIGDTPILEMPGVIGVDMGNAAANAATSTVSQSVFTRAFQIGPRSHSMRLKVATHPRTDVTFNTIAREGSAGSDAGTIAMLSPARLGAIESSPSAPTFDGQTRISVKDPDKFNLTSEDFTITARVKTRRGGTIFCQAPLDGPWKPDGKSLFIRGGRLTFDIGWVGAVTGKANVADDQWHDVAMTWQHETGRVRLYVDGKLDGQGNLKPKAIAPGQTIRIGFTSPDFPDPTFFVGQLTEVRFFQKALSDNGLKNVSFKDNGQPLAHWSFKSTVQGMIRDETGHGHDGELSVGIGSPASDRADATIAAGLSSPPSGSEWRNDRGSLVLSLPAGAEPLKFVIAMATFRQQPVADGVLKSLVTQPALDLASLTHGGPRRWTEELKTTVIVGPDQGPFAVDVLSLPSNNPWFAQLRLTGFDFFPGGDRLAVCSWDGDVWQVSGLRAKVNGGASAAVELTWRRIASGLFQPLGLKIVDGQIHVACRDQIAILRDLNGDNETDFVECFNNDHQVTEHFHEFAMGLQTDDAGNFYYAKSGRHALAAVVPHHGTLLRVRKDGSQTEILATGFRAANGVCLNPDGSFVVTDQEGFWNPKNRINWVIPAEPGEQPRFYGNMLGYTDVTDPSDGAMEPPLCWATNAFDRSPAELLWVTSDKWGPLKGSLLNLSYGYGKVFVVPFEKSPSFTGERNTPIVQGGMCELPLPTFPTGIMRGRFHPVDGQLYTCGMFAWAGNAIEPGGFYRIRATGRPVHVPIGLTAHKNGMRIKFSGELNSDTAADLSRYEVRTWSLLRSADYGSKHYDEKTLRVASARLSNDRRTITLELPEIQATWCMSIEYKLAGSEGEPVNGLIHNTIHWLSRASTMASE